jgi:hypothetical protein
MGNQHYEVVRVFIQQRRDLRLPDSSGDTVLHYAVEKTENIDIVGEVYIIPFVSEN